MRVFILGPMAGVKGFNFDRFDAAELYLIEQNVLPVNPAHFRREQMQIDPRDYPNGQWSDRNMPPARAAQFASMALGYDTGEMFDCDMVAVLPEGQMCERTCQLVSLARGAGKSIIELHPNCIDTTKPRREPPFEDGQAVILPMPKPAPQTGAA